MIYTSHAHREGTWWIVQSDQVPGAISQVATLDQSEEAQREAIAFVVGGSPASISVTVTVHSMSDGHPKLAEDTAGSDAR